MDFSRLSIVFAALLICGACAQRPFYASGGSQYPGVLPQNTPATPASVDVDPKFGENNRPTPEPYQVHEKDPAYNVDKDLVNRVKNDYPRDKQPFWFANAAHINSVLYQQQQQAQQQQQQQQQQQAQQQAQVREIDEELIRRRQEEAERAPPRRNNNYHY